MDLLQAPPEREIAIRSDEPVLVCLPVFAGRIPGICAQHLAKLRGNGAPAIAVVVYGNRDYDDALLELGDILTENGFRVIGAAALIARHTIFAVAEDRPNATDYSAMDSFIRACAEKLAAAKPDSVLPAIKGSRPYKVPGPIALKPAGNDACISCGICSNICPVGAIKPETPRQTDGGSCISCTACIFACPQDARGFHSDIYPAANANFMEKNSKEKQAEFSCRSVSSYAAGT